MLSRQYSYTIELIVKAKMNLKTLAERTMPNIETLVKNNKRHSKFIEFVNRYWHYDNILQMGEKRFCRDYINWEKKQRYHNCEQKAKQIYSLAQSSISVLPYSTSTKIVITEATKCIYLLETSRVTILTQLFDFLNN